MKDNKDNQQPTTKDTSKCKPAAPIGCCTKREFYEYSQSRVWGNMNTRTAF